MPKRKTAFVSLNLTPEARDELRQAAINLTGPVGRRLSMSEVLLAALNVAATHRNDLIKQLGTHQ